MDVSYTGDIKRRSDTKLKRLAESIAKGGDLKQLREDRNILIILLYYFHLEGFLNLVGNEIWSIKEWEIIERAATKKKLHLIADKLRVSLSKEQEDAFKKMHCVRNDLVHPKPYRVEKISGTIKNSCVENVSTSGLREKFHQWHKYEDDDVIESIQKHISELCMVLAKKAKVPYTCGDSISANIKVK